MILLHNMFYRNISTIFDKDLVLLTDFYSIPFLQHKHQHIIHPSISIYSSTMQQISSHVKILLYHPFSSTQITRHPSIHQQCSRISFGFCIHYVVFTITTLLLLCFKKQRRINCCCSCCSS